MRDDAQLRRTVLHRALHRPNLFLEGEREPMLLMLVVAGSLIVTSMNLVGICLGVLLWGVSVGAGRRMAKADPYMTKVYSRYLRYRRHYSARNTPWGG